MKNCPSPSQGQSWLVHLMMAVFNFISLAAISFKHSPSDISSACTLRAFKGLLLAGCMLQIATREWYNIESITLACALLVFSGSPRFESAVAIATESISARTLHWSVEKTR